MPKTQQKCYNVTVRMVRVKFLAQKNYLTIRIQICLSVAIIIEHQMLKRHIILLLLVCLPLPTISFQLSHQTHIFQKHTFYILVFSET